ncbi:hypothetical protein M9979_02965 [Sphingomonas sp. RP10(2022)]|uniref:Swt1-like HEPN domain-containing protein n=1 Tax=Sphingomonas liriopis TaxID=2949094 RepID=A0A9X2HMQ7_9SPHN|nr:hypothetical protein [Sphingomonas liriopis]MCP3733838.1 hypothetical protein [Sphingomonas liriopis]
MFSADGRADFCSGNAEEGYRLVYNIEAYLRHMVRFEIVAARGRQWRTLLGAADATAKAAQRNERDLRIIDADERNILSYLLLTELKDVMLSEAVWLILKNRWPPQDIFASSFKVFNALRNKVAHFRRLTDRDMRSVREFRTLVEEMTAHYRSQRRAIKPLTPETVPDPYRLIVEDWLASIALGEDQWQVPVVSRVHRYLVIEARLATGTIASDAISALVNGCGTDAFFLSIDGPRVQMRAYLPCILTAEEAQKVVKGLRELPIVTEDMLEEEADTEAFDLEVPFEVLLPMDFRT